MAKPSTNKFSFSVLSGDTKAVVLLIVLAIILVSVILAAVVMGLMLSQGRLTHHEVSRIQAYYASFAGVNYALEQLRTGVWRVGADCTPTTSPPCRWSFAPGDFRPASIVNNRVTIIIIPPQYTRPNRPCYNPPGGSACVSATAEYTYTP